MKVLPTLEMQLFYHNNIPFSKEVHALDLALEKIMPVLVDLDCAIENCNPMTVASDIRKYHNHAKRLVKKINTYYDFVSNTIKERKPEYIEYTDEIGKQYFETVYMLYPAWEKVLREIVG